MPYIVHHRLQAAARLLGEPAALLLREPVLLVSQAVAFFSSSLIEDSLPSRAVQLTVARSVRRDPAVQLSVVLHLLLGRGSGLAFLLLALGPALLPRRLSRGVTVHVHGATVLVTATSRHVHVTAASRRGAARLRSPCGTTATSWEGVNWGLISKHVQDRLSTRAAPRRSRAAPRRSRAAPRRSLLFYSRFSFFSPSSPSS